MSDSLFGELEELKTSQGAAAAIERLIETLTQRGDYEQLFDALLLKKRFDMGLSLIQPSSSDGVPEKSMDEFEKCYIDSARKVGHLFLEDGKIARGWVYLRSIQETKPVRELLEKINPQLEPSEETDELINVALYEGAHPAKGLEIMLRVNGTCNTITALDQQIGQLEPEDRRLAAALLVRELYEDLCGTVRQEVEERLPQLPPGESLRNLLAGRDWIFENDNYHIDVSHLNAVVRFARFLEPGDAELDKAIQLAEYGGNLSAQFQYPADPPFDDFYPAHQQFFKAIADDGTDEALAYFLAKIDEEPDEDDKPMIAYVLVDLLIRLDRLPQAMEVASRYLRDLEGADGFSFSKLCEDAGRMDALRDCARDKGDAVTFAAALIQGD